MQKSIGLVALSLFLGAGCGESEGSEAVAATQEGVAANELGIGVMAPSGVELPNAGLRADDLLFFIRSFEPATCSIAEATDLLEGAVGFQWALFFVLPAADVEVGRAFRFGGNDCEGPDCLLGHAESIGGQAGPAGVWSGSGHRCGDDSYDLPAIVQIVAVGETSVTVEISDLCFTDSGPLAEDLSDDPADDVTYRVDGRYEIALCGEAETGAH